MCDLTNACGHRGVHVNIGLPAGYNPYKNVECSVCSDYLLIFNYNSCVTVSLSMLIKCLRELAKNSIQNIFIWYDC